MGNLLKNIWSVFGIRYAIYLIVMVFAGLVEGLALVSVVPLLSVVGIGQIENGIQDGILVNSVNKALNFLEISPSINSITILVLFILWFSTILFIAQAYLGARLQVNYVYIWQSRLINSIFSTRLEFFHLRHLGDIVNCVISETQRLGGAFYQLGLLLTGIVHGIIFFAISISLSTPITLAVLAGGAILFLFTRPLVHRAYRIGTGISRENSELQTLVTDFVSGVKILKTTATEHEAVSRTLVVACKLKGHFFKNAIDIQIAKGIFDFGGAAMMAIILYISHFLLDANPAITLAILVIFVRMMPKLSGIQQSIQSLSLSFSAVQSVNDFARFAEARVEPITDKELPTSLKEEQFAIKLKEVTVMHDDSAIIQNLDLAIDAGSCVAVVGKSGVGKSTLVDAILGLVPLSSGNIEINGYPIDGLPLVKLRRCVGYITQDTILFHGTLRDNILWGRGEHSDNIALEALRLAAASDFLKRLPAGLDSIISNSGSTLSGGERQRLGLARALVGSPSLLILDEATSALDAETEFLVTEVLRQLKGKVTIIMIAHRLSSLRLADKIHVMDKGIIIESGTWSELKHKKGHFADLWRIQTSSPEE